MGAAYPKEDKLYLFDDINSLKITANCKHDPNKLLYPREVVGLEAIGNHSDWIYYLTEETMKRLNINSHEVQDLTSPPHNVKTGLISPEGSIYALTSKSDGVIRLLKYSVHSDKWKKFAPVPYNLTEPVLVLTENFYIFDSRNKRVFHLDFKSLQWSLLPFPRGISGKEIYCFGKDGYLWLFDFMNQIFLQFDEGTAEWKDGPVERKGGRADEGKVNSICLHQQSLEIYAVTSVGKLCYIFIDSERRTWTTDFPKRIYLNVSKSKIFAISTS